jgi:hypothetical protein
MYKIILDTNKTRDDIKKWLMLHTQGTPDFYLASSIMRDTEIAMNALLESGMSPKEVGKMKQGEVFDAYDKL